MIAKLVDVTYLADKLQIKFEIYLEEGELHYEDYLVDNTPTPCNVHFASVKPTAAQTEIQEVMKKQVAKVKLAWESLDQAQSDWVGLEVIG